MNILFLGDSITDASRNKEDPAGLGNGYVSLIAGELNADEPGVHRLINLGSNGFTVYDIAGQFAENLPRLAAEPPDLVTILVGINDAYYDASGALDRGPDAFESCYASLLDDIGASFPQAAVLLMLPYLVRRMDKADIVENQCPALRNELEERRRRIAKIAKQRSLRVIDLQAVFDKKTEHAPGELFSPDSVHPSAAGNTVIKNEWMRLFRLFRSHGSEPLSESTMARVRDVYAIESDNIRNMLSVLDEGEFAKAVRLLAKASHIGTTGCGHSGIVCRHMAHLLCCIERPARFLSPAEALHGASGFLSAGDVMIFASRGGQTEELIPLMEICRARGVFTVVVTEKADSPLARQADAVLRICVSRETDRFNTQGTTSTTAQCVIFHALQTALIEETGFVDKTFALIHPGGAVGKRLNEQYAGHDRPAAP